MTLWNDKRVFIIAEAGVNHNGDGKSAKKLVDAAKECGADAIKFQTFNASAIVTFSAKKTDYQVLNTGSKASQYSMLKGLELSKKEFIEIARYAERKKIIFLSTPFDIESVDLLSDIGVPAFKIASGEITNFPLINYIAGKGKPVILSTGMSYLSEVKEAVGLITRKGIKDIALLHCVSDYPARPEDVNLKAMQTLKRAFGKQVGLSDHTNGIIIAIAAVGMGACIIEKHFTLDKKLKGPDHKASLEPDEFISLVRAIRQVEKALGNGVKEPAKSEEKIRKAVRKSIVAKVDIKKESLLDNGLLEIKRPGTGISPKFLDKVIGRKTRHFIRRDSLIRLKDLI